MHFLFEVNLLRREYFIILSSVVLFFGILCVESISADVNTRERGQRIAKNSSLYSSRYEVMGNRSDRDIAYRGYRGYEYYKEKKKISNKSLKSGSVKFYKVMKGDTLFRISKKFNVQLKQLELANKLNNKHKIFVGMTLRIPVSGEVVSKINAKKTVATENKLLFKWPLKRVKSCRRDGNKSVQSIGIIIKSTSQEPVLASEGGVVEKIGYMRGYGNYIVIKHQKRYITVYSNIGIIRVNEGENVRKGGVIGNLNKDLTLHFQIDYAGKAKNPLKLLPARG